MDNAPRCLVVVEQTLEVGHVDRTVGGGHDVEVLVVGLVLRGWEVMEEGNALGEQIDS